MHMYGAQRADFHSLLERAGYRIRGNRADCPYCEGSSRLTVGIGPGEVYCCHRCKRSGNHRTIARQLHIPIQPESREVLERRALEQRFDQWCDKRQKCLAKKFHALSLRAQWAKAALAFYPDWDLAWNILAEFYDREADLCVALDALSYEKTSVWLDEPTTKAQLFAAFQEACCAAS